MSNKKVLKVKLDEANISSYDLPPKFKVFSVSDLRKRMQHSGFNPISVTHTDQVSSASSFSKPEPPTVSNQNSESTKSQIHRYEQICSRRLSGVKNNNYHSRYEFERKMKSKDREYENLMQNANRLANNMKKIGYN